MRDKTRPNSFWGETIRNRIARQVNFIRHWKIEQKSYDEIEPVHGTWYIDPPYQLAGKYYRKSSRDIDYGHLGKWCLERSGQIIVCENAGADWLDFQPFLLIRATNKKEKVARSDEVIFVKETGDYGGKSNTLF